MILDRISHRIRPVEQLRQAQNRDPSVPRLTQSELPKTLRCDSRLEPGPQLPMMETKG